MALATTQAGCRAFGAPPTPGPGLFRSSPANCGPNARRTPGYVSARPPTPVETRRPLADPPRAVSVPASNPPLPVTRRFGSTSYRFRGPKLAGSRRRGAEPYLVRRPGARPISLRTILARRVAFKWQNCPPGARAGRSPSETVGSKQLPQPRAPAAVMQTKAPPNASPFGAQRKRWLTRQTPPQSSATGPIRKPKVAGPLAAQKGPKLFRAFFSPNTLGPAKAQRGPISAGIADIQQAARSTANCPPQREPPPTTPRDPCLDPAAEPVYLDPSLFGAPFLQ